MSTDRGDALFVEEDYEGAIAVYSATIIAGSDTLRANLSREPDGSTLRALVHRSAAHAKLARFEDAAADAARALGIHGGYAPAHLRKGIAEYQLGHFANAEAALHKAVSYANDEPDIRRQARKWLGKVRTTGTATLGAPRVPPPPLSTILYGHMYRRCRRPGENIEAYLYASLQEVGELAELVEGELAMDRQLLRQEKAEADETKEAAVKEAARRTTELAELVELTKALAELATELEGRVELRELAATVALKATVAAAVATAEAGAERVQNTAAAAVVVATATDNTTPALQTATVVTLTDTFAAMQKLRDAERAQEAAYDAKKTALDAQVEAKTQVLAALEAKTQEVKEQLQDAERQGCGVPRHVGVNTDAVGTADTAVPAAEMTRGTKRHQTKTGRGARRRMRRIEWQARMQGEAAAAAAATAGRRVRRAAQPAATYLASAAYFAEVGAAAAAAGEQATSAALQAELEEARM